MSLAALVAHHRGALPHVVAALDGLEVADVRALLWERAAVAVGDGAGGAGAPAPNKIAAFRRVFRRVSPPHSRRALAGAGDRDADNRSRLGRPKARPTVTVS